MRPRVHRSLDPGTNWMVSMEWWDGKRSLESANMENFPGQNVCPEDTHREALQPA